MSIRRLEEEVEIFNDDDYITSWSWAIFAIFMWLVPQVSIIVGDYRESLFNSIKWNKRSSSRITREEQETVSKNGEFSGALAGDGKEEQPIATFDRGGNDSAENWEEEEHSYEKGNVVIVDEDESERIEGDGTRNDSSRPLSFITRVSKQATSIVLAEEDDDKREKTICPKLKAGLKAVRHAALMTICLWMVLIAAAATGISLGTVALDERMALVLDGLSRVFGAIVMSAVSFTIPKWSGIYFGTYSDRTRKLGKGSLKELRFHVRWTLHRPFCTSFLLMLPFFEGITNAEIPISLVAGVVTGFIVDASVYFARRFKSPLRRKVAIGLFAAIFGASAALVMADGAWFIAQVWLEGDADLQSIVTFAVVVGWFLLLFVAHMIRWCYSRSLRHYLQNELGMDSLNESTSANPTAAARPRMATSLIMGRMKGGMTSNAQDLKGKHGWVSRRRTDEIDVSDILESDERPQTARSLRPDLSNIEEYDEDRTDETQNGAQLGNELQQESSNKRASEKVEWSCQMDDVEEPTYREMFNHYTCCGCVRRVSRDMSRMEKVTVVLSWTVWWILILGSIILVIVNLGSTYQQEAVRVKLPYVSAVLYDNMDEGHVCAFDDRGPDSNITTFPNKEAAHAEGFLVVHCGECAACSDWHNLRLEYTTRNYLAKESARCARKSLFGGADAVTSCLEKPPIGFQGKCAVCWTEDILCTKKFCTMIFLQSIFINTVGNFQVGPDTITAASCEEAHCEAGNPGDFVYCSGATRRRMNVTSTIGRPGAQRCGIVDVVWEEVFPE